MRKAVADGVELVVDHDLCHLVYNAQQHIDEIMTGVDVVVPNGEREEGVYYALPHRHYDLRPGEIVVAEFAGDSHTTRVEPLGEGNRGYEPCLWFPHEGKYYAVMFSASRLRTDFAPPRRYRADAGLMHRDYAYPWTEFTDPAERSQSFVLDYQSAGLAPIVTVVWRVPEGQSQCLCQTVCVKNSGTGPHHVSHTHKK